MVTQPKIGDLRSRDHEKDRYGVYFVDKDLKACLVNQEKIRIHFELPEVAEDGAITKNLAVGVIVCVITHTRHAVITGKVFSRTYN
jgi:hypothetical protein